MLCVQNVISSMLSGTRTPLAQELASNGAASSVTLAFASGECGSESWGGVDGATLAQANVPLLLASNVKYTLSTGGAAGVFTCGSDAGFNTFINRWASANLLGVDFDIEGGQTPAVLADLLARVKQAHVTYPSLVFSFTVATQGTSNNGQTTSYSLGSTAQNSLGADGTNTLAAISATFGFQRGSAATWPAFLTVNLMAMDYGSASTWNCVVVSGACQGAHTAIQAAYNLRDYWGIPFASTEITIMIGKNDDSGVVTVGDAATLVAFAKANRLRGVHYWSYDRDTPCAAGSVPATCNSFPQANAGAYLKVITA
jgi:chitinase